MAKYKDASAAAGLTQAEVDNLLWGTDLLSGFPDAFQNEQQREAAFLSHEKELIVLWAKRRPLTRPELWWRLCAAEPKKAIGYFNRAMPTYPKRPPQRTALLETEAQYLSRLKLLLTFEKKMADARLAEDETEQKTILTLRGVDNPAPDQRRV